MAVSGLRNGAKVNGVVIAVTQSDCRIFRPATNKGASKTWGDYLCDSAGFVKTEGRGYSLVCLFGDGNVRAYSIPGLKEIGCTQISNILDVRRFSEAIISPSGDVIGWTGPSEVAIVHVWGSGTPMSVSLFFPQLLKCGPKTDRYLVLLPTISFTIQMPCSLQGQRYPTSSGYPVPNMSHLQTWIC